MLSQSSFNPSAFGVSADSVVNPFAVWVPLADHVDAGKDNCSEIEDSSKLLVIVVAVQPIPSVKMVRIEILIWTMVNRLRLIVG